MTDRPAEVRVGVVGLGYWGPNLVRVLVETPGVQLAWLCDLDESRLDRLTRRYPSARTTTDLDDLLNDAGLDAIALATPVPTHHPIGRRILEAGKHLLVEKPLAPSTAEADDLIDLAAANERALMCGHTFLYSPPVLTAKQLLDDGEIGDVLFVTSTRVNLGLHQKDVSVIWDLAPHDLSILRFWLDETPSTVSAIGRDSIVSGIPDVAFLNLKYPSEVLANVELSWLAPSKLRRTVIVGSRKMLIYDDTSSEPIRVFDHGVVYEDPESFGAYQLSYRTGDILSPRVDTFEPLGVEMQTWIDAIRAGAAPDGHLSLARDVVAVAEAAERSLRSGGDQVIVADVVAEREASS
jgi:predicted dehydrogenase